MSSLFADLQWRGLVHQTTDPAIEDLLDAGGQSVYYGCDPTADSLHIGNLVGIVTMRRMQLAGHRPILLAGGSTGMIGDPSFKATERPLLDLETLEANIAGIQRQLGAFIDFEPGPVQATMVNNLDWTKDLSVLDFLRDIGKHFTVNRMIAKESVRARLEDREQGISYTEFSYSLLQAFDYWHLYTRHGCAVQVGGSDQWGNIVAGVDLVRRRESATVHAMCWPLVTKSDGTKFGKTESGAVWLDPKRTSPYQFFQFFLRAEDVKVVDYLKYFTFLSHERIDELAQATVERPQAREAQRALAEEVTRLVHGDAETERAIRASSALFSEAIAELDEQLLLDVFADAPSASASRSQVGELSVVDALVAAGLSASKSAARTAIQQGGVSVNNRKRTELDAVLGADDLLHGAYVVLRRGKREFAVVRFEG